LYPREQRCQILQIDDVLDPDFILLARLRCLDGPNYTVFGGDAKRPEFRVVLDAWNYIRRCDASDSQQDKTEQDQNSAFHLSAPFRFLHKSRFQLVRQVN
jgi:hypothetical protein